MCRAFLALLFLAGGSGSPTCPLDCTPTRDFQHQHFQHVSELGASSVAPWTLTLNSVAGREPEVIQHAVCRGCTLKNMVAKPIYIQITVYQRLRRSQDIWCCCPYQLAVGCTCVHNNTL